MPKAILLTAPGDAQKLVWQDVPMPEPKAGEVLIRQHAVGLNFIDIYHRTGFYPLPSYPAIVGMEGAGVVEKLGADCKTFAVGDRVAYGVGPLGGYSEYRVIPESKLVALPKKIAFDTAASLMLKGLTVHSLLRRVFKISAEHTILVHAAAGGVGLLLCQWAKHIGARVIGTVGSEQKAARAKAAGCDEIILYRQQDVAKKVRELTGGQGVQVVYDAVGKDTYTASLDSLAKLGLFVSFGQASGPMPPIESQELSKRGSLFFTRPSVTHYMEDSTQHQAAAKELLELVARGILTPHIGQRFALSDAAAAHVALESGKTEGSTVFTI